MAEKRRQQILAILSESELPQSATTLAKKFSVSRQVVVGDIALLRAGGLDIISTPRGYVLESKSGKEFCIICTHGDDTIKEELYTIVDLGGSILDVTVAHSVYGELTAPLNISSRYDVDLFVNRIKTSQARPLCDLTGGIHAHNIGCENEEILEMIKQELDKKGFLFLE